MIRTGDTIHNPVTGERVTFLATSADTDGEAVVIETVVQPDGCVAAAHVHPAQSERFAVKSGALGLKTGRKKQTLGPGRFVTVEPGTAHRFWNAGDEPVTFICEIRHAQSAAARRDRERAFRHGAPAVPAGVDAEGGARARRSGRTPPGLRADVRRGARRSGPGGVTMRRRFYFVLLVLALILLALPGFAAKAARRVTDRALLRPATA